MSPQVRRKFLRTIVMGAGLLATSLLGFIPVLGRWAQRLRPPGALQEQQFLAACIKCGQCVQVCPVEAIKQADRLGWHPQWFLSYINSDEMMFRFVSPELLEDTISFQAL